MQVNGDELLGSGIRRVKIDRSHRNIILEICHVGSVKCFCHLSFVFFFAATRDDAICDS